MDRISKNGQAPRHDGAEPRNAPASGAYEPPRIVRKRSVAAVTLVSGTIGGPCTPGQPDCGNVGGY